MKYYIIVVPYDFAWKVHKNVHILQEPRRQVVVAAVQVVVVTAMVMVVVVVVVAAVEMVVVVAVEMVTAAVAVVMGAAMLLSGHPRVHFTRWSTIYPSTAHRVCGETAPKASGQLRDAL